MEHLGAKAVCSHVAPGLDGDADLRPLRHFSRGLRGGGGGLPPGVVCQGDPETSRWGEGHPGTEGGEEAARAGGHGQHPGAQPERQTGVHAESGSEQEPVGEELTPHPGGRDSRFSRQEGSALGAKEGWTRGQKHQLFPFTSAIHPRSWPPKKHQLVLSLGVIKNILRSLNESNIAYMCSMWFFDLPLDVAHACLCTDQ